MTAFGEMTLTQHDRDVAISVAGVPLMDSRDHRSEDELGRLACKNLAKRAPRVLIGGLGLAYTLRAALDVLPTDAHVDVVEIVPDVIRWNRTVFGHLTAHPLDDPRVTVIEGDVGQMLANPAAPYAVITLDVDNGPDAIGTCNTELYRARGLRHAYAALEPSGVLAVWSSFESKTFTTWLERAGFAVDVHRVRARESWHWIFLARK
jgi:spermidine synthase